MWFIQWIKVTVKFQSFIRISDGYEGCACSSVGELAYTTFSGPVLPVLHCYHMRDC